MTHVVLDSAKCLVQVLTIIEELEADKTYNLVLDENGYSAEESKFGQFPHELRRGIIKKTICGLMNYL